jgi:hypothetical protein
MRPQGSTCSLIQSNYVTSKGARVVWLSKDLRHTPQSFISSPSSTEGYCTGSPQTSFQRVLETLGGGPPGAQRRPVYVSINAGVMQHGACPGSASTASSSIGLTADEILDMAVIAGSDPNVSRRELCHDIRTSYTTQYLLFTSCHTIPSLHLNRL